MPNYRYKAITQAGEIVTGSIAAPTAAEVARRIEYLGLVPVDTVTEERAESADSFFTLTQRAKSEDVTVFTLDLALLLKAGARLDDALELLVQRFRYRRPAPHGRENPRRDPVGRKLRRGADASSFPVSADVCRAGARRRSLRLARRNPRSARRRTGARRGAAPQARRCAALSGVRAACRDIGAVVFPAVRAAAICLRAARLQRQARSDRGVVHLRLGIPARERRGARGVARADRRRVLADDAPPRDAGDACDPVLRAFR